MFDPYHKWLGIPKDQRPPTYYQLLGIAPGETDAEVIDEAAVRQTTHVRAYQIGQHAADCTRLLNEIAHAKLTLLNPAKRQAYDEQLATAKASKISAKATVPAGVKAAPAPASFRFDEPDATPVAAPYRDLNIAKPARNSATMWILLGAGGGLLALAVVITSVIVASRPVAPPPKQPPVVLAKPNPKIAEPPKRDIPANIDKVRPNFPQKPPPGIEQPPNNAPPAKIAVPGARSFKIWEKRVEWLSLSPDGSKVALGFLNPSVYEVATGKQLVMFPPREFGGIIRTPVAFLPDNARVLYAYGSERGKATVGEVATGKALFVLEQEKVQYATAVAVDRDGKRALVAHNYRLVFWDLEKQEEIKRWTTKGIIEEVIFTPDGQGAVSAEKSGLVVTWDLNPNQLKPGRQFNAPSELRALAIAPDGATIAAGSKGGIALLDVKTQQVTTVNSLSLSGAVAFCSGGKHMLAGDSDGEIRIFDIAPVKLTGTLRGHKTAVTRIAVDAKENIAVSGDMSGRVVVWPLGAALLAKAPPPVVGAGEPAPAPPGGLTKIGGKTFGGIYRLAILPDGKSFLSGGLKLSHWDMNGTLIRQIAKKKSTGNRLAMNISSDGRRVAWGENKDNPTLFDVATGGELGRIASNAMLGGLAISPEGTRWCAAFEDRSCTVWDVAKQKPIQEIPLAGQPFCLAFTPDGMHLMVCLISGQTQWYDTTTWQVAGSFNIAPFPSHPAFTPDGQTLAMASAGRGIVLIDTVKLQPITDLPHSNVQHVAFCAKGQLVLAVSTSQATVAVWDSVLRTKVALWELPEPINSMAVDRQASFMLAVTRSGHAYTWPLPKTRADLNVP